MPDLITHTAFAYLIRKRNWQPQPMILLLFGAMLPDLLSRPFIILLPDYAYFFHTFHTPVGLILFIILISLYFEPSERFNAFKYIGYGAFTHLFLDLFQKTVNERGYSWLFPFSYSDYQIGLFLPEDSLLVIPYILMIVIFDFFISFKFRKRNEEATK